MKINSIVLADTLSGQCEQQSIGHTIFSQTQRDPKLAEMLWFLESLSRTPGKLEEVLLRSRVHDIHDEWGITCDEFQNAVHFLQKRDSRFYTGGNIPEVIRPDILKIMEQHAANAQSRLADTKVSKLIFEQLNLALRHKVPLMITGDSRFGKTKAVSVWSEMRPGRVRLVAVPESNRDWDFFAAHADAFGIEYNDRTSIQRLKRSIQHVIQNSGFFICYDEAHFLTPVNYTTDTPPKRINWVRCQVIDKGVGIALFATPQSLSQTLEKYTAKTKYNLEQWFGRIAPPVILADYYDREELMAVAKIHFPEFPEKLLALICARAMQSEQYLKSMEFAARYASALASERQRRTPSMQDVDDAIERMMPTKRPAHTASEAPSLKRVSRPVKPGSTRSLAPVLEDAGVVAGNTGQTRNFTSRRPGLVADLDRAEPLRADRALVPA